MFGERPIFGRTENVLSDKNRITLPAWTGAEKDDSLLIVGSDDNSFLKIYKKDIILKTIDKYKYMLDNFETENFDLVEAKYQLLLLSILGSQNVDGQRRIQLTKKLVERFTFNSSVYLIGCNEYLGVFKNQADVSKYKAKLLSKIK